MPTAVFDRHLAWLAASGGVVDLDAALAGGGGGIVLSFDDGYRDFHEVVVPMLVHRRLPAILYLATGLVSERSPDRLRWGDLRDPSQRGSWRSVPTPTDT